MFHFLFKNFKYEYNINDYLLLGCISNDIIQHTNVILFLVID